MQLKELKEIYNCLLESFGPQGWWPSSGSFTPPEWEVCVGAILTQNTSWKNVEKALDNMKAGGMTGIKHLLESGIGDIEQAVRPSGFYRQKAERLKAFAGFVNGFGNFKTFSREATREQLLGVNGIGPETADSILLYALNRPSFVIDAYTKRVFTRMGYKVTDRKMKFGRLAPERPKEDYELWKWLFESGLPKDAGMYGEFHALIVKLAKRHCRKIPVCVGCPLEKRCGKVI